ncbi:MAG: manganese efflux pump MntP family protein [Methanomicrobiaceae archaeon]|nr:manganese efflux pump MntP family protein [Methanomicrobiaceae archaeon]
MRQALAHPAYRHEREDMDIVVLSVLIGIGLAMDCFVVSLSAGASYPTEHLKLASAYALAFGFFQSGMCLLGWALSVGFASIVSAYDHWVAFFLLLIIGLKMIHEGLRDEPPAAARPALAALTVLSLAVATSIDALAVGISFAVLDHSPYLPAAIIGMISLLFSFAGVLSGRKLVRLVGSRADILGGLILILLGVRVLAEHVAMF